MSISLPRIGRVTLRLGFPVGLACLLVVVHACGGGDSPTGAGDQGTQKQSWTLTVTLSGDGVGTVTSQPSGIDCSSESGGSTTCAASFEEGSGVTLTAAAGEGDVFQTFSKGCTGTTCTLTLTSATTVDAAFDDPGKVAQDVDASGGTIVTEDSTLTVVVPQGALSAQKNITVQTLDPDSLGSQFDAFKTLGPVTAYEFGPSGTTFDKPITLTFKSEQVPQVGADSSVTVHAELLLVSNGTTVDPLQNVTTVVDPDSGTVHVTGELSHFSRVVRVSIEQTEGDPDVGKFKFNLNDVPDHIQVNETFDATVRIEQVSADAENRTYVGRLRDQSSLPIEALKLDGADADFAGGLVELPQLGDRTWGGTITYGCEDPGEGTVRPYLYPVAAFIRPDGSADLIEANIMVHMERSVTCVPTPQYELTVSTEGEGQVTSDPAGIDCPDNSCSAKYDEGTAVTLTATPPDEGWFFKSWSGDCTSTDGNKCVVKIAAAASVTATFTQQPDLSVNLAGQGSGTVTSSPAGIKCPTDCVGTYAQGTTVTLTATADGASMFVGWSGQCTSTNDNVCTVTLDASKLVTANFATVDESLLEMHFDLRGNAVGSLTSDPSGLKNCARTDAGADATCSLSMPDGQEVHIIPHLDGGAVMNWINSCDKVEDGNCVVTNRQNLPTIKVYMVQASTTETHTLTVTKEGQGTVQALDWVQNPPGDANFDPETVIDCGDLCQASVNHNTNLEITATAADGWVFDHWSGSSDCEGTISDIIVVPLDDLTCKATFRQLLPPEVTEIQAVFPASIFTPTTTEYSVEATDPMNGTLSYDWKMEGEECGDPKVPWEQTGRAVDWSHSSFPPDNCQHVGTDHQVTAYVTVTSSASGLSVTCSILGSENLVITNPSCSNGQAGSPSRSGPAIHGAFSGAWTLGQLGYWPTSARHRPWRGPPLVR